MLGLIILKAASNSAAEATNNVAIKLQFTPPFPGLVAAASTNGIPLNGIEPAAETNTLRPGDEATVLVTFVQKKKRTQWAIHLEASERSAAQATNKPGIFEVRSAFGPPLKFESRPYPVKLRLVGPFAESGVTKVPKRNDSAAQFTMNEDFLALGMDGAARLLHGWSQRTNFDRTINSTTLLAMEPTAAEQRTVSGVIPAMFSYFEIVQHTDGLEDLFRALIHLPSLWSIVWRRGVEMTLTFDGVPAPLAPGDWEPTPVAPAYYFPWLVQLNGQPALKLTLITTTAQRPLLLCGGVVGLLAEKVGDNETWMTFRIVSARRGAEAK